MPNLALEAKPSSKPQGQKPTSPLPVQPRPLLILAMVQWLEPQVVLGIRTVRAAPTTVGPHPNLMHLEKTWPTQI